MPDKPTAGPSYACRVANIRKHQLLKPEIKVLVTAIDSITPRCEGICRHAATANTAKVTKNA
jgi:hypothetical protein